MQTVIVIGERDDLERSKSSLKTSAFKFEFLDKDEVDVLTQRDPELALLVLPWQGYREILERREVKRYLDKHSVIVVGSSMHFFDVENLVLEGSVSFLCPPINSTQIECIINEVSRNHEEWKSESTSRVPLKETA